jgi:phospholipase/carboxylesterase
MNYLPAIEIEPTKKANAAVIWLHGLGASGDDFAAVVPALGLSNHSDLNVRFIFPHAPTIPVSVNGGMSMPAWYDILSMDVERKINQQQFMQSAQQVKDLIERELDRGISSDRIVIAGFSQGGAVAYEVALNFEKPLAGLMALSTYVASPETLALKSCNALLPVMICHGTQDNVVPESLGLLALEKLGLMGLKPEYKTYIMAHSVSPSQIKHIASFLERVLSDNKG